MSPSLPEDVLGVVECAAAIPRGLAFLHMAPLETVAITLGLDARLVEKARRHIDDASTHAGMIEAFKAAVARWKAGGQREESAPPGPGPLPEMGPEELVRAARRHSLGLSFLAEAPPESVAVIFGVHPFVVFEARELLEKDPASRENAAASATAATEDTTDGSE